MYQGKYVISQILEFVSRFQFQQCVEKYAGNKGIRAFTCWQQFLCLVFGQLTQRNSLRSIVICLNAQKSRLYHLGFNSSFNLTTLTRANENRDWRIYHDLVQILIQEARRLYQDDSNFELNIKDFMFRLKEAGGKVSEKSSLVKQLKRGKWRFCMENMLYLF
jgi:hypothetical protein